MSLGRCLSAQATDVGSSRRPWSRSVDGCETPGVRLLATSPQAETQLSLGQTELFERPAGLARLPESAGAATELAMVTLDLPGLQVVGSRRTEAVSESEARLLCALARAHDRQLERWQVAPCWGRAKISVWQAWRFGWAGCARSWCRLVARPGPSGPSGGWATGCACGRW